MSPRQAALAGAAPLALAAALTAAAPAGPPFVDRTRETGLDFVHVNGMSGRLYILEIIGAGGALFDYDGDGDLDLYAVQGGALGPGAAAGPGGRLFRNDLGEGAEGARTVRFVDVTSPAAIRATGYGMGAATGDFDNDGWTDLLLTHYGADQLLRNRGDGTFEDVTRAAGVDGARWSTAASAFDYDRDGWLDLYVGGYLDFTYDNHTVCRAASTAPDYCGPKQYRGLTARLLRNRGHGRFEDVSAKTGLAGLPMKTLGTVAFDADEDGWPDLYAANDGEPNALWISRAGQSFRDDALLAGVAVNRQGQPEGSMGVDAADYDGDGDDDLFMTHLTNEKNALFVSLRADTGQTVFEDRSLESGLGAPSLPMTGFGTLFTDYDQDGWLDLPVANGAVYRIEEQARAGERLPLRQRRQLFRNRGDGTYADASAEAGPAFAPEEVGRGLAAGDLDNDGDADLVVFHNHGPARVLINEGADGRPWVGLRLLTGTPGRDALGARVTVERADGRRLRRRVHTDGSYLSASDPRVRVGLGAGGAVRRVTVHWPDGGVEEWGALDAGRYHTLRRGTGRAAAAR
jgi:hypothetical protein